jgi:hypothetical protein
MIALSEGTRERVRALFQGEQVAIVEALLVTECGDNLPLHPSQENAEGLERIRFAALRLSQGDVERLRRAVTLAKTDWRDLLVAAEFARDADAHRAWFP